MQGIIFNGVFLQSDIQFSSVVRRTKVLENHHVLPLFCRNTIWTTESVICIWLLLLPYKLYITGCRVLICPYYDSLGKEEFSKVHVTFLMVQTVHLTKLICKYVHYFPSILRQTFTVDYEVSLHFFTPP